MKLDPMKWRFCRAIQCDELEGGDCKAKQCKNPDVKKALDDRRKKLKEAKYGRPV